MLVFLKRMVQKNSQKDSQKNGWIVFTLVVAGIWGIRYPRPFAVHRLVSRQMYGIAQ